nr:hypothetical protein [Enterocloster clostridioformis]
MAAQLWQRTDNGLLEGNTLARGSYGQGNQTYSLMVEGLEKKAVPVEMVLSERVYTKQEALKAYEAVMEQLPKLILGNNPSLEDVRQDLNLLTYLDSYGIRLRWESDEPELLDSFGELHVHEMKQRGIDEQGIRINLHVRMTEGKWPEEYELSVCVKPPVLTEQEQTEAAFAEFLKKEDELQSTTAYMKLPKEYQGRSLQYSLPEESVFVPVMGLGAAGAVLCFLKDRAGLQNRAEARKRQLALDYPEVLSRLTIFLGAGMSIRTAWDKIALEYNMMVEQGRRRKRYVYEEMYETSCRMKGGVPEGSAFEEFGRRCGLQSYMKLGGLLEQNRKNGSKNLKNLLRTEMTDAFEQRKHQARRLGEEAGTKLLLPLFILLSVVMVMIAVPALMEFK